MKKFLTVLLALSVVFTYTVGTVWLVVAAGTTTTKEKEAETEAQGQKHSKFFKFSENISKN